MSAVDPAPDQVVQDRAVLAGSRDAILRVASIVAIAVGVALLMWQTTRTLFAEWSDTENLTYTHGWLIAAVSLWSILRARARLLALTLAPQLWLALALSGVSIVWLVAFQAGLLVVHQALLPLAMWLAVCAICGWAIARECAFAFAYLYFAVPVWSLLNSALQSATTGAMKAMLPAIGVPTYFVGNTVYIPSGVFEIAGGCSGLHFFIVGLAIASLYGEINRDKFRTRFVLVAAAAALSILANWVRVSTIIVAGHLTEMQHFLVQVDHYYFGWFVFAVTMILFFYWASRIPQNEEVPAPATQIPGTQGWRRIWLTAFIGAVALGVGPMRAVQARTNPSSLVMVLPQLTGQWAGPQKTEEDWQPKFSRADAVLQGTYGFDSDQVEVFAAHFREQRQGKELSGAGNTVLGEGLRQQGPRRAVRYSFGERLVVATDGTHSIVWDRYQVGSRTFYSASVAQLWYGLVSIGSLPSSSVLAIRTQCMPDCDAARRRNEQFIRDAEIAAGLVR